MLRASFTRGMVDGMYCLTYAAPYIVENDSRVAAYCCATALFNSRYTTCKTLLTKQGQVLNNAVLIILNNGTPLPLNNSPINALQIPN